MSERNLPPEQRDPLEIDEPLYDPEDTPPSGLRLSHALSAAPKTDRVRSRRGSPLISLGILAAAALLTTLAAALYLGQPEAPLPAAPTALPATLTLVSAQSQPPAQPPAQPPTQPPTQLPVSTAVAGAPLVTDVPPDVLAGWLQRPADSAPPPDGLYRAQNAFTIAPARSRSSVIDYRIQPGDTLEKIAARFGISQDTIVWNNDGIYVNRLLPGDTLTILPENGVLHKTRTEETIQAIADRYKVSPYIIVDSDFNPILRSASPTTLLPAGISVMVPGGVSDKKPVYWDPGITFANNGRAGSGRSGGTVSFGGGPGSCGAQPNSGGTGSLGIPISLNYTVTRGFTAYHTGIDLSAPVGTSVFAADGGTVIFAGWSNWGYGNSVVIAHGWIITLYGHLSRINVSCGQAVSKGTLIGAVGNTGNSTGPHLHFEVRVGEVPQNPEGYLAF